jgi:hypothetical protein
VPKLLPICNERLHLGMNDDEFGSGAPFGTFDLGPVDCFRSLTAASGSSPLRKPRPGTTAGRAKEPHS